MVTLFDTLISHATKTRTLTRTLVNNELDLSKRQSLNFLQGRKWVS